MKPVLLLFFSALCLNLNGQNDDWLQDPAFTYLIEVEAEVSLEETLQLNQTNGVLGWERLKLAPDCPRRGELTDRLSTILLNQIEAGELNAQTTKLGKTLTFEEVSDYYVSLDTVVTFHPATYEEMVQVVRYQHRLSRLRLKIQLGWNDELYQLQSQIVGIYAIGHKGEDQGILFYVPLPTLPWSDFDINDDSWGWVGKSELTLDWESASLIKGTSVADFIEEVFLEEVIEYYTIPVYADRCDTEPLVEHELIALSNTVDTIITFSPDTYEETIRIIKDQVRVDNLSQARLGLNCYFSTDLSGFYFVPQFLSPLAAKRKDDGSIRFQKPLYYLRFD